MTSPRRPQPPTEAVSKRAVADAVGRRLKDEIPPPERPFREDVVREVHDLMTQFGVEAGELGPYIQQVSHDIPGRIGGKPKAIAFDQEWWDWFAKMTPEMRASVLHIANELRQEERREALNELIDERIERDVLRKFFRRLAHITATLFLASVAAVHWFSDQLSWFMDKVPVLKAFWNLVTGARN